MSSLLVALAVAVGTAAAAAAAAVDDAAVVAPSGSPAEPSIDATSPPPSPSPPPPPYFEPPLPRRYGDRGNSEAALGLGYSSLSGFSALAGFRHFVLAGVAPGLEASYVSGGSRFSSVGMVLAGLRLVPFRTTNVALVLTGRAGRVFIGDHADGWGAGGGAGLILSMGSGLGIELGYEALRLLPSDFCADLQSCVIHGPVLGLRLSF